MVAGQRQLRTGLAGLVLALATAAPLRAQVLPDDLPYAARQTATSLRAPDSYAFPTGPAVGSDLPPMQDLEGTITRRAWVVRSTGPTSLQLMRPLREQLQQAGFEIVLDCAADRCGGFDFRFALQLIDPPAMNVDLFDFRALTARRGGTAAAPDEMVFVLTSRSDSAGYVQVVEAGTSTPAQPVDSDAEGPTPGDGLPSLPAPAAPAGDGAAALAATMAADGRAVLSDLRFATGAVRLADGPAASLRALARLLDDRPAQRLLLVGHTDSDGSLDTNRDLSRQRAEAVRRRLIEQYGIAPDRIEAHGVGYLAPLASNATEEGRKANRRVEAVLLP